MSVTADTVRKVYALGGTDVDLAKILDCSRKKVRDLIMLPALVLAREAGIKEAMEKVERERYGAGARLVRGCGAKVTRIDVV